MKYSDFLKQNRPERIEISAPEMVQGIAVEFLSGNKAIFRQWMNGQEHHDLVCTTPLDVWWKEERLEDRIVFTPDFHWREASGMSSEKRKEISKLVLDQLGISEKVVKFPEKVISLPVPSAWVDAECCNGCVSSAYPYSIPCFASEAREMISEFEKELGKIKEELK